MLTWRAGSLPDDLSVSLIDFFFFFFFSVSLVFWQLTCPLLENRSFMHEMPLSVALGGLLTDFNLLYWLMPFSWEKYYLQAMAVFTLVASPWMPKESELSHPFLFKNDK